MALNGSDFIIRRSSSFSCLYWSNIYSICESRSTGSGFDLDRYVGSDLSVGSAIEHDRFIENELSKSEVSD